MCVTLFIIFSSMLITSSCICWLIIDFYAENGILNNVFEPSILEKVVLQQSKSKTVKKSNFIFSNYALLFVCYLGMVYLHKNARNICVAICSGFTKTIASLP